MMLDQEVQQPEEAERSAGGLDRRLPPLRHRLKHPLEASPRGGEPRLRRAHRVRHRVEQAVLGLDLAVDALGHRPEGADALAQRVDAPVVVPLERLRVDLLCDDEEEEEFLFYFFF